MADTNTDANANMLIPLHDYQIYAKEWVKSRPFSGLFLKMGLGKTSIILETLYELNPHHHVLIIAPKTIARCTWVNEIKKWKMPLRTQSLIVNEKGRQLTKKQRLKIYSQIPKDRPTIYFINREMITDLVKNFPKRRWPFKTIVIDESQSFKAYNTARFKAMQQIRPYIERMVLLTGSPTPKGIEDLWAQIWLLDMGQRLERTITAFRNKYFTPGLYMNGYTVTWNIRPGAENVIYEKISDLVISMKNDQIQLPEITFNNVYAEMTESEFKKYKKLMKTNVLELTNGEKIEAANAAVLIAKLSQMASGSIYDNPEAKDHHYEVIHEHKLELCEYIINNTTGCVLVAYHFVSDRDMLLDYFKTHDIPAVIFDGSPEMERDWNRQKYPVMLLQPASCGFGLNLQDGGETLIWYTLPWSLEQYEQTNARIYRQGQKNPVMIHHIMTKNTIDTKILNTLAKKDTSQKELINAIEATIEDIS